MLQGLRADKAAPAPVIAETSHAPHAVHSHVAFSFTFFAPATVSLANKD